MEENHGKHLDGSSLGLFVLVVMKMLEAEQQENKSQSYLTKSACSC